MKQLSASEAASHLPELLEQLQEGEELLLEVAGKVVAKLTAVPSPKGPPYREPGFAKGEFKLSSDFDAPLEDFRPYM